MPKLPCVTLLAGVLLGSALQAQPASLVKDIRTGELVADWPTAASFVELGGVAYLLWTSDGTPAGTARIGTLTGYGEFSSETLDGDVFFQGTGGLWKSDGTENGTVFVKNIPTQFYELTVAGDRVYFRLDGGFSNTSELWSSDGTEGGTGEVPLPSGLAVPNASIYLVALGDELVFPGFSGFFTVRLWKTDGTEAGTILLSDVSLGSEGVVIGDTLLFRTTTDDGRVLWKTDGTPAGTQLAKRIDQSDASGLTPEIETSFYPEFPAKAGHDGTLLFAADDGTAGRELWSSDGTEAGTSAGNRLFYASTGFGGELWKLDAGASTATNLGFFGNGSELRQLTALGGNLFFTGPFDGELWRSDGTAAGTFLIQDVAPGPVASTPTGYMPSGDNLYFTASDGVHGFELWVLDRAALGSMLAATKRVMSPTYRGSTVVYETVITNTGAGPHPDLAGDEMGTRCPWTSP